jgi:putative FmdB family regulatory protein
MTRSARLREKNEKAVINMPTYEYECSACGKRFEAFQGIKEEPLKKCPTCGGKVDRLISGGSGVIFKGPGFYQTDYKNKSSKKKDRPPSCPGGSSSGSCKGCSLKQDSHD